MKHLLSGLVTSNTRIKILVRLFANPTASAYLRGLAGEFALSTNAVREELGRLTDSRLLTRTRNGRQILYRANRDHPLFAELSSMVQKALGLDIVAEQLIARLGRLERAILTGDYAEGRDTGIIDLTLVGDIDRDSLDDLVTKTEKYIKRKIRTLVLTPVEYENLAGRLKSDPYLILWEGEAARA